jgi:sodium-independent sulfate anion transporter 11
VQNIDVSSTQVLVDVRKQLDKHAAPDHVEWHFVNVKSPWTKRALVSAGFGRAAATSRAVFSLSEVGASVGGFAADARQSDHAGEDRRRHDEEIGEAVPQLEAPGASTNSGKRLPLLDTAYPAFHITIDEALESVYSALKIGDYPGSGKSCLSDAKKQ